MEGSEIHGGVTAARALRAAGIDTVFALPGGHVLPLFEGARREGIRIVDFRHEEAAVLAAVGHALATGRPAAAAVTAGPGVTNAVPGLAEARAFGAPVVLIAGRTALRQKDRGAVQDLDQIRLVRPVTTWQRTCLDPARIAGDVAEAVHRARAAPSGPTFLDIPQDVWMAPAPEPAPDPRRGFPPEPPRAAPPREEVARAVEILAAADHPVIVAGGGAFWSGAGPALTALCERTGIPATTTSSARGLLPDDHPLSLGSLIHGGIVLASSDAVLVLGSAFNANLLFGGMPLFPADGRVIQVDASPAAVGGNRLPDLAVAADAREACLALAEAWPSPGPDRSAWVAQAREGAEASLRQWDQQTERPAERIHPGLLARETARFARELGPHTFVCDGGDSLVWGLAFAHAGGPGRHPFTGSALGTLGVGLPFAIGARVARPDEPVILFTGDGSFGLTAMELDTAARHGLPVVVVVANNGGWGDVRHEQRAMYGREADTGAILSEMRYDLLAEAAGGHGETIDQPGQIRPALERAASAGVPALVNALCDAEVMSDLMRNLAALDVM